MLLNMLPVMIIIMTLIMALLLVIFAALAKALSSHPLMMKLKISTTYLYWKVFLLRHFNIVQFLLLTCIYWCMSKYC